MECTQKKQLVAYPRVRIEKTWIRQFYSNKKYRNEGTTHLFSLVSLYSYANFRSNYRMIEGDSYLESPGQWICRIGSLPRIMRVHSKEQAMETMKYLQDTGFLRFEYLPTEQDWIRFELSSWTKYCVHLEYNYYSYKASGFFFFPLPIGRALMKTSAKAGERIFSELDAVIDMWLHTVYDDPKVIGSELMPVLYYTDLNGVPLVSNAYLAQRWGWSKSRVTRFILRLEKDDFIGRLSFSSTRGSIISMTGYMDMIQGTDTDSNWHMDLHGILELVALVTGVMNPQDLIIRISKCGPCERLTDKMRYVLEIEALGGLKGTYSACRVSLIYNSHQVSRNTTVEAGTKSGPQSGPKETGKDSGYYEEENG